MKHFQTEHKTIVIPPDEQNKIFEEAMKNAQRVTENAISQHWLAFLSQMRDKVGVENITLDEPYLKFEIVRNTLEYLKTLENIEHRFTIVPETDKNGLVMNLNAAENRHEISVKQNMDERRQQQFGIKKYVWRTAMDDRVRPSHAASEGKVFEWKDGDGPGTEVNCRCSAEPFPEYTGADDPPIKPVYPLETLLAIYAGLSNPLAKQIARELLDLLSDDKPKPEEQKPIEPAPKPESLPAKPAQGKEPPAGGRNNTDWEFGQHKSETKWNNRMQQRGWTEEKITDTIKNGKEYPAPNKIREKIDPKATATRYEKDGKFVVRDDQTGEILQISDDKFIPKELP